MQAGGCLTSSISLSRRMLLGVLSTSLQGSSSAAAGAPSQPRCPSPAGSSHPTGGSSHPTGRSSSWSGCGQRQVSIPAGQREQQLPNPSAGRFPSSVQGLREGPEVRGNGHEAEPTAQLPATAQVPCCAVPCRALAPRQAVPPLHTELQGCMATRGGGRGGGGGGREGREGFYNCSPGRRGEALRFPSLPTARLTPQLGRGQGCAAVLVAAGDKCLSQPRAQDGCGCSPCPRAGGQQFPARPPEGARGMSECSPGWQEICPRGAWTLGRQRAAGAGPTCAHHPPHLPSTSLSPGQLPSVCPAPCPARLVPPSAAPELIPRCHVGPCHPGPTRSW